MESSLEHSPHTSLKASAAHEAREGRVRDSRIMGNTPWRRDRCLLNQPDSNPAGESKEERRELEKENIFLLQI